MNLYSHFPGKCKPLLCVITGVLREKERRYGHCFVFFFSGTEVHVIWAGEQAHVIRFGRESRLNVTLCLVVVVALQTIGAACRDSEGSI